MNRSEFVSKLSSGLNSLPEAEIEKSLAYYIELINDRIEDGCTEEEAIEVLGNINDIVREILVETSFQTIVKGKAEKVKNYVNNNGLWVLLLIIGFPIWVPVLAALFAVCISIIAAIFSIIVAAFAVISAFGISAFVLLVSGTFFCFINLPSGLFQIGSSMILIALLLLLLKPMILFVKVSCKFFAHPFKTLKNLFYKGRMKNEIQ